LALSILLVLAGLALAEVALQNNHRDWRLIGSLLYYQKNDWESHRVDPDPDLLYRLRPGKIQYPEYRVTVNSLGVRGPERPEKKPEGVFRILCFGGSNVYGQGLNDDQTWPARLEARLNAPQNRNIEVWNMGACGYVGSQTATLAAESVKRFAPDAVILALANKGSPPFLWGNPPEEIFNKDPDSWRRFRGTPETSFRGKRLTDRELWLLNHSAFFRLAFFRLKIRTGLRNLFLYHPESKNVQMIRGFLLRSRDKTRACIFLAPGMSKEDYGDYFQGTGTPVFALSPKGKPEEYGDSHPPAHVMDWYAGELAAWLVKNRLL